MNKLPFDMLIESDMEKYRAETFWTKEPETIRWINGFEKWFESASLKKIVGDIWFFDIGANIGLYSLYAASKYPWLNIAAFEPHRRNYYKLCVNSLLNDFDNIWPINTGIGQIPLMTRFHFSDPFEGSSDGFMKKTWEHTLDVGENAFDPHFKSKSRIENEKKELSIPCIQYSLNEFCVQFCHPTFLKMDIDGGEYEAIVGAKRVIEKGVPETLIEMDITNPIFEASMEYFKIVGYTNDYENFILPHSTERRIKEKTVVRNIIFKYDKKNKTS